MTTTEDNLFRFRHSGLPGSITAIRLHYPLKGNAFAAHPHDSTLGEARKDIIESKNVWRLGRLKPWCASTLNEDDVFPQRAMMRTLSEFQSLRLPVDFRAASLRRDYKQTEFIPKASKFQFDLKNLIPRKKNVKRLNFNLPPVSEFEFSERKRTWNASTELDATRTCFFKNKEYEPMSAVNRLKEEFMPLVRDSYRTPEQRTLEKLKLVSDMKREKREELIKQQRIKDGTDSTQRVYKISNMHEWLDTTCGGIAPKPE